MEAPLPTLNPAELTRYSRHILLEEMGIEGQRKLSAARVLIVGAGGLGSPASLYLAAAGVGTLGIADFDQVAEHNLQRQLLHDSKGVGLAKVVSAGQRLRATNPFIQVVEHGEGVTVSNALGLFAQYDLIIDGTDRFSARYLNNDAAFFARRPLIFGSVYKFEGQVAVFDSTRGGPCYRCLFPQPPPSGSVPGCGEAGVLGALCGVIGSLQALEAVKMITGIGKGLTGRLLLYDSRVQTFRNLAVPRDPTCPLCGTEPHIHSLQAPAYSDDPGLPSDAGPTMEVAPLEISVAAAQSLRERNPNGTLVIDVREPYELEICRVEKSIHIPMRQIPGQLSEIPRNKHLLILCHSGGRSLRVTQYLRGQGFGTVSNITGGIDAWALEVEPGMARY